MSKLKAADGIYRDQRTGAFYWRPKVNGKWTFRKLHAATLKVAKEERSALITDRVRMQISEKRDLLTIQPERTVIELCAMFQDSGCPDRTLAPRVGKPLKQEHSRIRQICAWSGWSLPQEIDQAVLDRYAGHRRKTSKWGHCGRAIDLEVFTLRNTFRWAKRMGFLDRNPFVTFRPERFSKPEKHVVHCRDRMPQSAEELHCLAAHFFEMADSAVFGWQMLFEAFTGVRTSEALGMRVDAKTRSQPGCIDGDILWLARAKNGTNNFFRVHPPLQELLDAHRRWLALNFPTSPWFFPSPRNPVQPVGNDSLTHALRIVSENLLGRRIISHAMRAFYVTVRRSQGAPDGLIALEIGQRSGGREIVKTYGDVLPINLDWMPSEKPAWSIFDCSSNVIPMSETAS